MAELGCGVPWMSQFTDQNETTKLSAKASKLYDFAMKSGIIVIIKIIFTLPTFTATCRQPCCTMEVDMTNKFTTMTGEDTSLEVRFPPTIKEYKEIEIYALFNMLAGNLWEEIGF